MSGVILVVIEDPDHARPALEAAGGLAALMGGARINVLAPRVPPEAAILPTEEVLTRRKAERLRLREDSRVAALRAVFDAWSAASESPDVCLAWTEAEGAAETVVGDRGRRSDFIVVSRSAAPEGLVVQAALFDTDRPVLVVPPHAVAPIGRRVAIAWRDDRRTIRAVLAALRVLSHAEQVHVLAGVREGAAQPALPAILAEHGIAAGLHVLPVGSGVFGAALLARAHALGADLLVMGAYTHSPWRELVLGGVTRHMLSHADLPVLMRH